MRLNPVLVACALAACTPAPVTVPSPRLPVAAADVPTQCAVDYAAVLDVLGLAQRYGSSAAVFQTAFDDLMTQLGDCLAGASGAAPETGAQVLAIAGRRYR